MDIIERDTAEKLVDAAHFSTKSPAAWRAPSEVEGITVYHLGKYLLGEHERYYVARVWANREGSWESGALAEVRLPYGTDDRALLAKAVATVTRRAALLQRQRRLVDATEAATALEVVERESAQIAAQPLEPGLALLGAIRVALAQGVDPEAIGDVIGEEVSRHPAQLQALASDFAQKVGARRVAKAEQLSGESEIARVLEAYRSAAARLRQPDQVVAQAHEHLVAMREQAERAQESRDAAIRDAIDAGVTRKAIISATGITKARVSQIMNETKGAQE